jgi:hypothetical protein
MKDPKVVILLFGSGKLVCTGAKKEDDVYRAVNNVMKTLLDLGIMKLKAAPSEPEVEVAETPEAASEPAVQAENEPEEGEKPETEGEEEKIDLGPESF